LNERSKSLKGSRLLLLGMAYKKDVDDVRESPSLKIMELLLARGARVDYNDPYFPRLSRMRHYDYSKLRSVELTPAALAGYDAVIISTDHSSYDYQQIVDCAQLVVDTRNATKSITRNFERVVRC